MRLDSFLVILAVVAVAAGVILASEPEFLAGEEVLILSQFTAVLLGAGWLVVFPALWKRGHRVGMVPWLAAGLVLFKIPIDLSGSLSEMSPSGACLFYALIMVGYVPKIRNTVTGRVTKGWNFMGGMWK
jgi:hypothetical protein